MTLDAPVKGNVTIHGGKATINNTINGNVQGKIGKLTLGPNAKINGDLAYSSEEKANIADSAVVAGKTSYTQIKKHDDNASQALITAGALYKLLADIILSVLFIFFFTRAITAVVTRMTAQPLTRMTAQPLKSGTIGFAFFFLLPLAAFILLLLIWLGIAAFLSYALLLLISIFLVKIFLGFHLLRWWENRNKKTYRLDWKAGVFGPIALLLIMLIPVLGWLTAAILFFIATGSLLQELFGLMGGQKVAVQKTVAAKKK